MNVDRFLEEFDRLAEVPDAVPRLRRFILDLAVRGRLLQQDSSNGRASDLLAQLEAQAGRRAEKGERRHVRLPAIPVHEIPFAVPEGWSLVRLGQALRLINGRAFKPSEWSDSGLPIVRIQNLNNRDAPFNCCALPVPKRYHVDTGDFLISWSGTPGTSFGAHIWDRGPAILNQHIFRAEQIARIFALPFLKLAINSRLSELIDQAHGGVGLRHITKPKLEQLPLTLPPLAEQHRIVAKVDELMALCDRLEAAQTERENGRDRLVATSLNRLRDAPDPNATGEGPAFYLAHLSGLSTRAEHVEALRRTILDLGVRGRLCRQNPNDTPASELLRLIVEERDIAVSDRTSRRRPLVEPVGDSPDLSSIPMGWSVVRVAEILTFVTSGSRGWAAYYSGEGAIFLRIGNLDYGTTAIDLSEIQHVSPPLGAEGERTRVNAGDILVSITGDTGMVGLVPAGFPQAYINQHIALLRPSPRICPRYLAMFFTSPPALRQLRASQRGIKNSLGLEDIRNVRIPLPPASEQTRIVTKIDELTVICDRLELQLMTGQAERVRLLEAVLHEALAVAS